jgi:hypothetical protein
LLGWHLLWLRFGLWRLNRLGLRFAGGLFHWKFQRLHDDGSQRLTDLHVFAPFDAPSRLLAEGRITEERLSRELSRGSILGSDGRDIIEAVDGDGFVFPNRNRQRPDFLAVIVDVVHALFLLSDLCCG